MKKPVIILNYRRFYFYIQPYLLKKTHFRLNIIFYFEISQIFFVVLQQIKSYQKWNGIL